MARTHDEWMEIALEIAKKAASHEDLQVGAIIVRDGQIIGQGEARVWIDKDPTAHAETVAIRDACSRLGKAYLAGATMYDTFEPCPMCCGAIVNSGISTLVVGGRYEGADRPYKSYSVGKLLEDMGASDRVTLVEGVKKEACNALMPLEGRQEWLRRIQNS